MSKFKQWCLSRLNCNAQMPSNTRKIFVDVNAPVTPYVAPNRIDTVPQVQATPPEQRILSKKWMDAHKVSPELETSRITSALSRISPDQTVFIRVRLSALQEAARDGDINMVARQREAYEREQEEEEKRATIHNTEDDFNVELGVHRLHQDIINLPGQITCENFGVDAAKHAQVREKQLRTREPSSQLSPWSSVRMYSPSRRSAPSA